jgi:hypothetical protein
LASLPQLFLVVCAWRPIAALVLGLILVDARWTLFEFRSLTDLLVPVNTRARLKVWWLLLLNNLLVFTLAVKMKFYFVFSTRTKEMGVNGPFDFLVFLEEKIKFCGGRLKIGMCFPRKHLSISLKISSCFGQCEVPYQFISIHFNLNWFQFIYWKHAVNF